MLPDLNQVFPWSKDSLPKITVPIKKDKKAA